MHSMGSRKSKVKVQYRTCHAAVIPLIQHTRFIGKRSTGSVTSTRSYISGGFPMSLIASGNAVKVPNTAEI